MKNIDPIQIMKSPDATELNPAQSRRYFIRGLFAAGASGALMALPSCQNGTSADFGVAAATVTAAAIIAKQTGNEDLATALYILAGVLAIAGVIAYYQSSKRQRQLVLNKRTRAANYAQKNNTRYVLVKTEKNKTPSRRNLTSQGRELRAAQTKAKNNTSPSTSHVMVYDTQKNSLKNSTVYEVANPQKGKKMKVAGTSAVYSGI